MSRQENFLDDRQESGADLSADRIYRYLLWRRWADGGAVVMFVGLNPSTADESEDDPTIRRCIRFSKDWGYAGLYMMNAYAYRATDPKVMLTADDPIGEENDALLRSHSGEAGMVIAAWGANCSEHREIKVRLAINQEIYCLGTTKHGRPRHPLYIRASTRPMMYWSPE